MAIKYEPPPESTWTPELVFERIEEAVITVQQIPSSRIKPGGFRYGLQQPIRRYFESRTDYGDPGYDDGVIKIKPDTERNNPDLGLADSFAIDRAYEVEDWLQWVTKTERELLWKMAGQERMYRLVGIFKRRRITLWRWKKRALRKIVERLNGHA